MKTEKTLQINGMSCGACVRHVSKALSTVKDVEVREVNVGSARIAFNPDEVREQAILHAVRDAGYYAELKG
jgi:copper chaperone CopZ